MKLQPSVAEIGTGFPGFLENPLYFQMVLHIIATNFNLAEITTSPRRWQGSS